MDKKTLQKFYDGLVVNLWDELMFFFPIDRIPKEIMEELKFLKTQDINNKVLVLDRFKGPIFHKKDRNPIKVFSKGSKLDDNIFGLLEREKTAKPSEFDYVLEKYFEQVEFLFYISDWMNSNIDLAETKDKSVKGMFNIQFTSYGKHFKTLIKYFYPNRSKLPSGNFDVRNLIDSHFPQLSRRFKHRTEKDSTKRDEKQESKVELSPVASDKRKSLRTKIRKPLVTEEKAEKDLLKSYFNVNFK